MHRITHMTYAMVAHHAAPGYPRLRGSDAGVNAFLGGHAQALQDLTARRQFPPGRFTDHETRALFHNIYAGTDTQFLDAADVLTKRLISRMDRRTTPGLLVAIRANYGDTERVAGVLKFEVVAEHAAVLRELESGALELSAARNMLDAPGDLQKGALIASWLADDRAMIGERLTQGSAYFPGALGIQIYQSPLHTMSNFIDVIAEVAPEIVDRVIEALPTVPSGEPAEVLGHLENKVDELDEVLQIEITHRLENLPRPVGRIETGQRLSRVIEAGPIRISGPVSEMLAKVDVREALDEGWRVVIRADAEPRIVHRR
ncbi:hypothetical protein ACGFNP_33910 [Nonomuraea sp. NPDC049269]|uniref:hypothetical protein n=1 Tax=Nonomuraea sp. NPDC049269 TaxID=3364349 RepID=UPI003719143E